jgi:hypothetical protein
MSGQRQRGDKEGNMEKKERALALWAVLFYAASSTPHVNGQGPDETPATRIDALLAQARPHIEAALGWPLDRLPRFRVTAEGNGHLKLEELEAQVRWQFPDLQGEAFSQTVNVAEEIWRSAAIACASEDREEILLFPDHLPIIASWNNALASVDTQAFYQLAMVNEVVRWAIARRYQLKSRRNACRDAEAFLALQAVEEGGAQWVTLQVARKLGTESAFPLLARRLLYVPDRASDPALRSASQEVLRQRHWACTQGLSFTSALVSEENHKLNVRSFTQPPIQSAWIDHPERYRRALASSRQDLVRILTTIEGALSNVEWVPAQQAWTPAMVKQAADMFGQGKYATTALRGWDEGRLLVWTAKTDPTENVAVSVARFESAGSAKAYWGFATELLRKQDEASGASEDAIRIVESHSRSVVVAGAEQALWSDKKLQFGSSPRPMSASRLVLRAGSCVIEIAWSGLPGDPKWAERIFSQLRDRL